MIFIKRFYKVNNVYYVLIFDNINNLYKIRFLILELCVLIFIFKNLFFCKG